MGFHVSYIWIESIKQRRGRTRTVWYCPMCQINMLTSRNSHKKNTETKWENYKRHARGQEHSNDLITSPRRRKRSPTPNRKRRSSPEGRKKRSPPIDSVFFL